MRTMVPQMNNFILLIKLYVTRRLNLILNHSLKVFKIYGDLHWLATGILEFLLEPECWMN